MTKEKTVEWLNRMEKVGIACIGAGFAILCLAAIGEEMRAVWGAVAAFTFGASWGYASTAWMARKKLSEK